MTNKWKKYILWFAQEHVEFRYAEFESIVGIFQIKYNKLTQNNSKPFWIVEFQNDAAALKFASRSVALRAIYEYWSHGKSGIEFHQQLQQFINDNQNNCIKYFDIDNSFKITVDTYNKHFSQTEKIDKIETLDYLPLKGIVDLKTPKIEWWYLEYWGLDPNNVPEKPDDILFGRLLANGQRHLIKELCLKKRKFIGNTSMDAQLSLLMANQACVCEGDLVFDPFCGTGSLLVSAAKFGGYVLGADIDYMMLHARCRPSRITQKQREKDESVRANLAQYGCADRYLDVVVSDFSNELWRSALKFDCIITDPPYGIRESTEKIETKQSIKPNTRNDNQPHYPSTSHYSLQELYNDLLTFAANHLNIGGRLVCWLPFHREDYNDKMIPIQANLELISNSEQPLTGLTSRRLLTYRKHSEPNNTGLEIDKNNLNNDFRDRYFNNNLESRTERRLRKAEQREQGRLEAIKRGKTITDTKEHKSDLNKARFK